MYGKTGGLKAGQHKQLQRLYRRRIPNHEIISHELTRRMAAVSNEMQRQVALLVTRKGEVAFVVVGDRRQIWIPDISRYRSGGSRLKGLRCIHTHLNQEPLSREDISDLALLGLDLMACIQVNAQGIPGAIEYANILPRSREGQGWIVQRVPDIGRLDVDFTVFIHSLEEELSRVRGSAALDQMERALLVGVTTGPRWREETALKELAELARSDDIDVAGQVVQRIKRVDPRFLMGKGRLSELALQCLQNSCNLLIFNNELTPAQVKSLTDFSELKIIDRSQLILDIFSRRAVTREGKIQVELAQLQYLLPRLATKNTAMSRLTGGIGGRGPGETKLEINRRRVRERIARLNKELEKIGRQRAERRRLRQSNRLPVISIVGYTNAGKSTLLNALTNSRVSARSRLFETLDPSSRRLRFPEEREAVITDTVGFIRDLPKSLMETFAATLEELQDADLLLHVIDATGTDMDTQTAAVERILRELDLGHIPILRVLNKTDLMSREERERLSDRHQGISVSALHRHTLKPLTREIEAVIWPGRTSPGSEASFPGTVRSEIRSSEEN